MFACHPIIPLIFSALELLLLIQQSIVKRHFFKFKTFISVLVLFVITLAFVFYNDFEKVEYLKNVKIGYFIEYDGYYTTEPALNQFLINYNQINSRISVIQEVFFGLCN